MSAGTPGQAAESLVPLSEFEARRLTRRINEALSVAWELVAEAYARRVWEPLGYGSWDAYCRAEFAASRLRLPAEEREETVRSLRAAGLSTRAIASATGYDKRTVTRDLSGGAFAPPESALQPVTGLDGKHYAPHNASPVASGEPIDGELVDESLDRPGSADRVAPRRRRPLSEQAKDAGWELRKAIERIARLTTDDRYPRHAEQMALLLRGHLTYATETATRLLDQLPDTTSEGDPR